MTPGQVLSNQIRVALSGLGARLFNTHVGKFWAGHVVGRLSNGDLVLRNPRLINVGVKGMSDLVGPIPVVVTPEMVGTTVALYGAIEVKAGKDRERPGQPEFIAMVNKLGGRAGVARSVEEALRIAAGEEERSNATPACPETQD